MRPQSLLSFSIGALAIATSVALAQQATFDVHRISDQGIGEKIGTASATESKKGGYPSGLQ